jgi:cell division protein FtsW
MDRWLLWSVLLLSAVGLLMVYSSSCALGLSHRQGNDLFYLQSQLLRWFLGVGILLVLSRLDLQVVSGRVSWILWGGLLVLLTFLLLPFGPGVEVRGACRWLRVGQILVQPSEFARLAMVIVLAGVLARGRDRLRTWRGVLYPAGIVVVTSTLVAAEPHMSLGLLIAVSGFLLIFLAGACPWRLAVAGAAPAGIALLLARGYHWQRLSAFFSNSGDLGYQARQSVLAIGSGGLIGPGLGKGLQKYFFLPDPHTDFILSVFAEEMGLLGLLGLFFLTSVIVARVFTAGNRAAPRFGKLLAYGVGLQFLLAFVMHAAVCLGLAPTTGVPYPLVSFGGSALVSNMMGLGLVLSLSRQSNALAGRSTDGTLPWLESLPRRSPR